MAIVMSVQRPSFSRGESRVMWSRNAGALCWLRFRRLRRWQGVAVLDAQRIFFLKWKLDIYISEKTEIWI